MKILKIYPFKYENLIGFFKILNLMSDQYSNFLLQKGIDEIIRTIFKSEILDFSNQDLIFPSAEEVFGDSV